MQLTITPFQSRPIIVRTLREDWNKLTPDIGCHHYEGLGTRFVTRRGGWYRIQLGNFDHEGYLPPRAILTIRPNSPAPTLGLLRPHGDMSDYGGVSGFEIDACGSGTLLDHDSIMQRSPIGLYDMDTGRLREADSILLDPYYRLDRGPNKSTTLPQYVTLANPADIYNDNRIPLDATPIKDAALRAFVLAWWAYNGQHLIRLFRASILLGDRLVLMDQDAAALDASLAWDEPRVQNILAQPSHNGNNEVGREFAWVSYLSVVAYDGDIQERMKRIVTHVQHRKTRILQRLEYGIYNDGSPDPWKSPSIGGSGVPTNIAVAQDIECYASVVALYALGMDREAYALANTVLTNPLKKWIGTDDGLGYGVHGAAHDQVWPALGIWATHAPREALEAMKRWAIPTQQGGQVGPFDTVAEIHEALIAWNAPGKTRFATHFLEGIR